MLKKERKKVKKLTDEIKELYDTIDKLNLQLKIETTKTRDQTLEKVRSISRGRKMN
jgi:hypothetical protein